MNKIDWKIFNTEFKTLNHNYLSIAQISKNGKITLSYLYRLFSKTNHPDTVTRQMTYRIGRGIGMSPQQSQNWTKKLLRHTYNPQLRKSAQSLEKLNRQNVCKSSKSNDKSSKNKSTQESVERMQNRHPVVKFCPVNVHGLSDLALHVKQLMGDKQISMKNLCKATYLNKQRLHDLFNGKTKTVSRLTAVRIADGLDIPPDSLFAYNHYTPKIKTVVINSGNDEAQVKKPLSRQIHELNKHDTRLIKDMVSRLLIAEDRESN